MNPHVCLLAGRLVGWLIGRLVGWSDCYISLKRREVTLSCSYPIGALVFV